MSLDGYLADEKGSIHWLSDIDITEEDNSYENFYKDVTAVVMGRTTYDQITTELAIDKYPYSNVDSYVITSQNREDKENIFFKNNSAIDVIKSYRDKYDGTFWVVGGSSLVQPLVKENIIDEYQIAIIPTLLGKGIKLFKEFDTKVNLNLKKTYTRNGMVYLTYTIK